MVSTPSYDANDFANGIAKSKWDELNNDVRNPMYNRVCGSFVPRLFI